MNNHLNETAWRVCVVDNRYQLSKKEGIPKYKPKTFQPRVNLKINKKKVYCSFIFNEIDEVYKLYKTSDPPRLRSSDKHIIGTNMFCLL